MARPASSDTAKLIARCILLAAKNPVLAGLVPANEPDVLRKILAAAPGDAWFRNAARTVPFRPAMLAAERWLLPGMIAHYLARKRCIETHVRVCIAAGIRQVVNIGAGCDTLALRLHTEFPEVKFFELDRDATQRPKRLAFPPAPNLRFLPLDLGESRPGTVLANSSEWLPERPAVVVAEGVTMYLEKSAVRSLAGDCGRIAGSGGSILVTLMERRADGRIAFDNEHPLVAGWLALRREPFRWGSSRSDLPAFLAEANLRLGEVLDHRDLRERFLRPAGAGEVPLARGEILALCSPAT